MNITLVKVGRRDYVVLEEVEGVTWSVAVDCPRIMLKSGQVIYAHDFREVNSEKQPDALERLIRHFAAAAQRGAATMGTGPA
jgi:hypothetical protein